MREIARGFVMGAVVGFVLWKVLEPRHTLTIYDQGRVDSLQLEIFRRDSQVVVLRDSLELLHYRDSIIKHRIHELDQQDQARLDSIYNFTDSDMLAWMCARYGHIDPALCAH